MSDSEERLDDAGEAPAPSGTQGKAKRKTNPVRLAVMLAVLGLLVFAIWWDRQVAIPRQTAASERVEARNAEINASSERRMMSSRDVQEAVGVAPISSEKMGNYTVEVYRWRGGLPWRPRDLFAVYEGEADRLVYVSHYLNLAELNEELLLRDPAYITEDEMRAFTRDRSPEDAPPNEETGQ